LVFFVCSAGSGGGRVVIAAYKAACAAVENESAAMPVTSLRRCGSRRRAPRRACSTWNTGWGGAMASRSSSSGLGAWGIRRRG
jgi:hypothetical protein